MKKPAAVIKAVGFANGAPCPHADEYLKKFDHEYGDGQGYGVFTKDIGEAKRFADKTEALNFWRRVPVCRPLRPDGKPNRPLTVLTVIIEDLSS